MERKINKRTGKCKNCTNIKNKKEGFIKRIIAGNDVFICKVCGYMNGPTIFFEYKPVSKQKLIFGQPIKKGKQ